jgi:hypothetical protein
MAERPAAQGRKGGWRIAAPMRALFATATVLIALLAAGLAAQAHG